MILQFAWGLLVITTFCFVVLNGNRWGQIHTPLPLQTILTALAEFLAEEKKKGDNPANAAEFNVSSRGFSWGGVIWEAGPVCRDPWLLNTPAQHMSYVMLNNECIDRQNQFMSLWILVSVEDKCLQLYYSPHLGSALHLCKGELVKIRKLTGYLILPP